MRTAPLALSLAAGWLALSCSDAPAPEERQGEDTPASEPGIDTQVFQREPVPEAGPGRLVIRFLVPPGSSEEEVRDALLRHLSQAAEDSTLLAARAVAYVVGEAEEGGSARVLPIGWAEWVPPSGWSGVRSRVEGPYRTYTWFGASPDWHEKDRAGSADTESDGGR